MSGMGMRRKRAYFQHVDSDPQPVVFELKRRVRFSEADAMGIVWFGRYTGYIEEASEGLCRMCGLSYEDFYIAGLRAPVVELHIDYYRSLFLAEEFIIRAFLKWDEGARINTEYQIFKGDGYLAASGYTVQILTYAASGEACIVSPALLERCRERWKAGEFHSRT
jgi:YbgC/YbaW family acyl-CoA thioester hydrolase